MKYCSHCGKEVHEDAEICLNCGCRIKNESNLNEEVGNRVVRFLLTLFLGFIGSFVINHSSLKPAGWESRTCAYFFFGFLTLGIYPFVASIFNLVFNPNQESNIGYFKS